MLGAPIVKASARQVRRARRQPVHDGLDRLLGTRHRRRRCRSCDTLLIVGSSFPYVEFYPKPGAARAVQIDLDPVRIGLRYPVEVGLVGDARTTLAELLPLVPRNEDRGSWRRPRTGCATGGRSWTSERPGWTCR